MAVFHLMRMVTVVSLLLVSAVFYPTSANEGSLSQSKAKSHVPTLAGAVSPTIVLPRLRGFSLSADAIHTAGWHNAGGGGEGAGVDDDAAEAKAVATATPEQICHALREAAARHDLPILFFARLIWQESRFKTDAVSRAGAQGVAQFMPAVAAEMGLEDPFDPLQALPVSARLLSNLYERFGNWGLAAAAYNGGPRRVSEWLSRKGKLPKETRHYVMTITGLTAEEWAAAKPKTAAFKRPARLPCDNLPYLETHASPGLVPVPPGRPRNLDIAEASASSRSNKKDTQAEKDGAKKEGSKKEETNKPWAVQLAAHWSAKQALASFERLQKRYPKVLGDRRPMVIAGRMPGRGAARQRVQIAMETRADADKLCARLKAAGGACLVRKNDRG